ncbi:lipid-binding SYLF domain-containing protein [Chlamydiota bacterium]
MKTICLMLFFSLLANTVFTDSHSSWKMQKRIDTATSIIHAFTEIPENSIPPSVLENCKGLAIISVLKGGFVIGGRGGGGILLLKLPEVNTWSAPYAIATGGISLGFQLGVQQIDFILILNTEAAIEALSKDTCTIGADIAASAGPVGRNAEIDATGQTAMYSYSRSKGLFAGISIKGTLIKEDKVINESFYGKAISVNDLLSGNIHRPALAENLYNALENK